MADFIHADVLLGGLIVGYFFERRSIVKEDPRVLSHVRYHIQEDHTVVNNWCTWSTLMYLQFRSRNPQRKNLKCELNRLVLHLEIHMQMYSLCELKSSIERVQRLKAYCDHVHV